MLLLLLLLVCAHCYYGYACNTSAALFLLLQVL
jgi:hypothetical protein